MKRHIKVTLIMLILLLTLSGCGREEKVSNRKFEKYLTLYLEYYEEVLEEEYDECNAEIFLDAVGNPIMLAMYADKGDEEATVKILGVSGRKIVEIENLKDFDIDLMSWYTDGFIHIEKDSDTEDSVEWYQIKNNELTKVAKYNHKYQESEFGNVTFYIDDEKIKIDLNDYREGMKDTDYSDVYERLCQEYYPNTKSVPADEYNKTFWLVNIANYNMMYNYMGFLHSPTLFYDDEMIRVDFDERVEALIEAGSMSAEEYLVWQCNYVNENELYLNEDTWGDVSGFPWTGVHFLYRDAELLNNIEIELDFNTEDGRNKYPELIEKLTNYMFITEDWDVLRQLEFIDDIPEDIILELLHNQVSKGVSSSCKGEYNTSFDYIRERVLELFDEELEGDTYADQCIFTTKFIEKIPDMLPDLAEEYEKVASELYKEVYAQFLTDLPNEENAGCTVRFDLAMINEDSIPELLVFKGDFHYNGVDIYTHYNEEVCNLGSFGSYGSVSYLPGQNIILSENSGMGHIDNIFYSINGNSVKEEYKLHAFEDLLWNDEVGDYVLTSSYSINDVEVSKEEYDKEFDKWYTSHQNEWDTKAYRNAMEKTPENISNALGYDAPQQQADNTSTDTNIDVEAEVLQIREWYNDTQSRLDSMMVNTDYPNLITYYDEGYPVKIVAESGYDGWNPTREYYYHDQKLYFIFVYSDAFEERYYFKDDRLIRLIPTDGTVINTDGSDLSDDWKETINDLLDEGNSFDMSFNCGN